VVRKTYSFGRSSVSARSRPFKSLCRSLSLQKWLLWRAVPPPLLQCTCCKNLGLRVFSCCAPMHNTSRNCRKRAVFRLYAWASGLAGCLACWTFCYKLDTEAIGSYVQFLHSNACAWYVQVFSQLRKTDHLEKLGIDLLKRLFHWQSWVFCVYWLWFYVWVLRCLRWEVLWGLTAKSLHFPWL
jgi:hypothetical protein